MTKLLALFSAWALLAALIAPGLLAADEPVPATDPAPAPSADPAPATEAAPPPEPAPTPAPAQEAPQAVEPAAPPPSEPVAEAGEEDQEREKSDKPKAKIAADASVTIRDFDFGPAAVTVNVGDTVTWNNRGPTEHTATGQAFDTGLLSEGESGSHTFNQAGTFRYICQPHPNMEGTVRVVASQANGDSAPTQEEGAPPATGAPDDTTAGGSQLADTGSDATALALLGGLLLAGGIAARRRLV